MENSHIALWVALVTLIGGSVALYERFHEDYITKDELEIRLLQEELKSLP